MVVPEEVENSEGMPLCDEADNSAAQEGSPLVSDCPDISDRLYLDV